MIARNGTATAIYGRGLAAVLTDSDNDTTELAQAEKARSGAASNERASEYRKGPHRRTIGSFGAHDVNPVPRCRR